MKKLFYALSMSSLPFFVNAQEQQPSLEDASISDQLIFSYDEYTRPFRLLDTPQVQLGAHLITTPFFTERSFGASLDVMLRITNNFSSGIAGSFTGRRISPTFGYLIGDARMTMYDLSWINELNIVQVNSFQVAARLSSGWTRFALADNSIKERYWVWTEYGGYETERALPVDRNDFFKVAPGLALRYRITRDVQIEASGYYNFYIGDARFGKRIDFNNYVAQVGIRVDID